MKCLAFRVLQHLPFGDYLYRAGQKYVTGGSLFDVTDGYLRTHQFHVSQYRRVHPGRAIEFGGGRHFLTPLLLSNAGATEVLVYDIQRLSSPVQINHTIRQLRDRVPGQWPEVRDWDDLERVYRIRYHAPGDARATGLESASMNFICSTSTLEHIPIADIRKINVECARVASRGAIISHIIDYADHWFYADSSIRFFNFYRYSESQWRWFNPPNHYQNRLRHSDFEPLFREVNWRSLMIEDRKMPATALPDAALDSRFQRYSTEDLLTSIGYFVLTPG